MATSVPVPTLACYQLGVIRERLDDGKGAVECFERVVEALRLDPSDTAAAEELQSLQR